MSGTLAISEEKGKNYLFEIDGQKVAVRQSYRQAGAGRSELELVISLAAPRRFTVSVPVPADCINACATLNGQLLISWFGDSIPDDLPPAVTSACQDHGTPVSTLRPGQVQNVNFSWQDGDRLLFYWIWPPV